MKTIRDFIEDYNVTLQIDKVDNKYAHYIKIGESYLIRSKNKECSLISLLKGIWEAGIDADLTAKQFAEDRVFMTRQLEDAIAYKSLPTAVNAHSEFSRLVSNAIIRYNNLQKLKNEYV